MTKPRTKKVLDIFQASGKPELLAKLADENGIIDHTISGRHRSGKRGLDLVAPLAKNTISLRGYTIEQVEVMAKKAGVTVSTIKRRINDGWSESDLTSPAQDGNMGKTPWKKQTTLNEVR